MLLECRNSSNTAQNLLRNGKCTLNFIPDDSKLFKEAVRIGWPGTLDGYEGPYHDFNGITSKFGAHFILRIDHINMKEKYWNSIVNGVNRNNFPKVPVDYSYRDSKNFWCAKFKKPHGEMLPMRETSVSSVRYAAERLQIDVKFTDDALAKLVKVPRVFLPTVLKGCVKWANENNCKLITEKEMAIINDKRTKEKQKK